ncbi:hypothetical protein Golax_010572, partial [Gossypium laxum]|nr:hypothetical protein [Gossypium laxum]
MPKPKLQLPIYALAVAIVVSPNHNFQSYVAKTRNKYYNPTVCGNVKIHQRYLSIIREGWHMNEGGELVLWWTPDGCGHVAFGSDDGVVRDSCEAVKIELLALWNRSKEKELGEEYRE